MNDAEPRPKAREGLRTTEHSKRGRRFFTIFHPERSHVTLLEGWEHDVLMLCDGTRSIEMIAELLSPSVEEQEIDEDVVIRCVKFFERQSLVFHVGLRKSDLPPPGPETMANLQAAYQEWHSEPLKTGQHVTPMARPPPFAGTGARVSPGLSPTVALADEETDDEGRSRPVAPGTTLVLAGAETVLAGPESEAEPAPSRQPQGLMNLLEAVDDAVREANALDELEKEQSKLATQTITVEDPFVSESRPPEATTPRPHSRNIQVAMPPVRTEPEAALNPTMVGLPAPERRRAASEDSDKTEELDRSRLRVDVDETPEAVVPKTPLTDPEDDVEQTQLGQMLPSSEPPH